ncbi:unnamed protein product, partial [Sphacelaria rigidula]
MFLFRPDACRPKDWAGVKAALGPHIVLCPEFAVFYSELRKRFPKPSAISVTARSTLLVTGGGEVTIEALSLDGALMVEVEAGASLIIRNLTVKNEGWVPTRLTEEEGRMEEEGGLSESIRIRGFRFDKKACYRVHVAEGMRWV